MQKKAKVLLVDDQSLARVLLKRGLESNGFTNILEAEYGEAALKMLREAATSGAPFQLVFCDINMPGMSGMEVLTQAKADSSLVGTHFVMVTAEAEMNIVMKALKAGALDYITKPVDAETLAKKINQLVNKVGIQ